LLLPLLSLMLPQLLPPSLPVAAAMAANISTIAALLLPPSLRHCCHRHCVVAAVIASLLLDQENGRTTFFSVNFLTIFFLTNTHYHNVKKQVCRSPKNT
jgi:hypothetical protein